MFFVDVNKSLGNSAHFTRMIHPAHPNLKIVYTKLHQMLKAVVARFKSFTGKVMFIIGFQMV